MTFWEGMFIVVVRKVARVIRLTTVMRLIKQGPRTPANLPKNADGATVVFLHGPKGEKQEPDDNRDDGRGGRYPLGHDWRGVTGGTIRSDVEGSVAGYLYDLVDPALVNLPVENDPVQFPATWLAKVIDSCQEGEYYWAGVGAVSSPLWYSPNNIGAIAACAENQPATTTQPPVLPAYAWGSRMVPAVANPTGWNQTTLINLRLWNLTTTLR